VLGLDAVEPDQLAGTEGVGQGGFGQRDEVGRVGGARRVGRLLASELPQRLQHAVAAAVGEEE
jgi:hypothetical protein